MQVDGRKSWGNKSPIKFCIRVLDHGGFNRCRFIVYSSIAKPITVSELVKVPLPPFIFIIFFPPFSLIPQLTLTTVPFIPRLNRAITLVIIVESFGVIPFTVFIHPPHEIPRFRVSSIPRVIWGLVLLEIPRVRVSSIPRVIWGLVLLGCCIFLLKKMRGWSKLSLINNAPNSINLKHQVLRRGYGYKQRYMTLFYL